MAEREEVSLKNTLDDMTTFMSSELDNDVIDAFLNGDEEIEEIKKDAKVETKKQPPVKSAPAKAPEKEEEEEEDEDAVEEFLGKSDEKKTFTKKKEDTKEEDTTQEDTDENQEPEDDSNLYADLASELVENGIFTLDEGEDLKIDSPNTLLERFQKESKKSAANMLENFLSGFGEDYKEAFDNIFVHGMDPREYFQTAIEISDLDSLDIESVENQKFVMREYYKLQGLDNARISSKIQRLEESGYLSDEAKDAQTVLVKTNQDRLAEKVHQAEQAQNQKVLNKRQYTQGINNIIAKQLQNKEFDGIPVDDQFARSTFSYLTQDVYQSRGEKLTQFDKDILDLRKSENWDKRVKIGMLMQLLDKDPTLSKLTKREISKQSNKLFSKVAKHLDKQKSPFEKKVEDSKISSFI